MVEDQLYVSQIHQRSASPSPNATSLKVQYSVDSGTSICSVVYTGCTDIVDDTVRYHPFSR